MSFVDLQDCFKDAAAYSDEGTHILSVLKTAFTQFKCGVDQFATSALKAHTLLKEGLPERNFLSTHSAALIALTQSFRDIAQQYANFASMMQGNVIEPIDLFYEHLINSNYQEKQEGLELLEDLQRAKESLRRVKHKYYECRSDADDADNRFNKVATKDREHQIQKISSLKLKSVKAHQKYYSTFKAVESLWAAYYERIPNCLQIMQENEESRIHFIKTTLEKLTTQHLRVTESVSTSLKDMSALVGNINGKIDLKVVVNCLEAEHIPEQRDRFTPYEDWKIQCTEDFKNQELIILDEDLDDPEHERNSIDQIMESVFDSDTVELDTKKLDSLLVSSENREDFIRLIEERRSEVCYSINTIYKLASLCNTLLTALVKRDELSSNTFFRMVKLSQNFYCQSLDGRRKYLSSLVSSHCIWSDSYRWERCIDMIISNKLEADRKLLKHQSKGFLSSVKTFVDKLPNMLFKAGDVRPEKTVAFTVISQFNFYMINLRLSLETACDIVLKTCKRVKLDAERTCVLLAELQANQRGNKNNAKDAKASVRSREKASFKWGNFLPIILASEFVSSSDLRNMLLVNREWRLKLTKSAQWRFLQEAVPGSVNEHAARRLFWISQTLPNLKTLNYAAISRDVVANPESVQKLAEIIVMDLKRSFHNIPNIAPHSLDRVLRAYAFYDPVVGYCQGMNYIAGALYLAIQNEEATFKALVGMIEKYRMSSLYNSNLPRLKLMLYQLDRLIGIYLPELHRVFKEEMIASSHFASSWFITLFASTLSMSLPHLEILYQIWDMFFEEGWKAIFKCSLAILMKLSEELAAGKLEHAMLLIGKVGSPHCPIPIFDSDFMRRMKSIRVSNSLLRDLESEYEHLKLRASMLPL